MLGTTLQFGGARGEDRFYIPVKARKSQNQRKQAQRAKTGETGSADSTPKAQDVTSGDKCSNGHSYSSTKPCPSVMPACNIDRFLESTRPLVPAQYFSKTTMRGWKTCDVEYQSYFTLTDLWESFKEWSVYGAGVPLVLDHSESVVQYYVPYLSGIQLYSQSAENSNARSRYVGEDSDGDSYRDSSSDGSSDFEIGKRTQLSVAQRCQHLTGDVSLHMRGLSVRDKHNATQEGFSSDDSETGNPQDIVFEYFEQDPPYSREPLADKIIDLSCRYSGLKSLRSCDLLPSSWMSVAWYPIYRIPTGPTLKDLDACFLTYHTLHTPLTGSGPTQAQTPTLVFPNDMDGEPKISIPTFAMASYKLKGSIWMQNGLNESQPANSLLQAADKWLRMLQVEYYARACLVLLVEPVWQQRRFVDSVQLS